MPSLTQPLPPTLPSAASGLAALDTHDQPVEALKQTLPLQRARLLDRPLPIPDLWQAQRLAHPLRTKRARLVLLVRKNQQDRVLQLLLVWGG